MQFTLLTNKPSKQSNYNFTNRVGMPFQCSIKFRNKPKQKHFKNNLYYETKIKGIIVTQNINVFILIWV